MLSLELHLPRLLGTHSAKMNYKSQYTPLEILLDGQWRHLNRSLNAEEIHALGDSLLTTLPSGWNQLIVK